ncbi:MAG: protease complex subunit PrcB family protein, partial [Bacteroidota bacterium]
SRPADRVLTSRRVSGQTLPKEVAAWVENCLKLDLHAFSLTKAFGNDTYVFVTVGRRPTGGYETRVVEVAQRGNQEVTVRTRFMRPEPDRLVTQALTTPFDVIAIERTELPVRVIPEGNDAPRWIASLVGIDDLPPIVAESRSIKVFTPPPRHVVERSIQVTGVASTTEGTIHYRLLDGDNRIMDGYMTAAQSLAWGYFAKEISVPGSVHATDSLTLELFSIDEREGEETDLVSVALRFEPQRMLK